MRWLAIVIVGIVCIAAIAFVGAVVIAVLWVFVNVLAAGFS